jgi:Fe2+ transport system protein FeoA
MSLIMYRLRRHLPRSHKHLSSLVSAAPYPSISTLADLRPGEETRLLSFSSEISPERLNQLQSYGLLPGCQVRVLQNWPVIVVQVEHTELAIENDLARQIYIRGDSLAGL